MKKYLAKAVSKLPAGVRNNGGLIATGVGVAAMIGGSIWACCKVKKLSAANAEFKENRETLKGCADEGEIAFTDEETGEEVKVPYSKKDYAHDLTLEYLKAGWNATKIMGGPILCELGGAAVIFGSAVYSKRQIVELGGKLTAAYITNGALDKAFTQYRRNVIEDLGTDADRKYRMGIKEVKGEPYEEKGKNGKKKIIEPVKQVVDPKSIASPYAIPVRYTKLDNADMNYLIGSVESFQKIAQNHYEASGTNGHGRYLRLGWVYDMLGVTEWLTPYQEVLGAECGWCEDDPASDHVVIFELIRDDDGELYLDFNAYGGLLIHQEAMLGIGRKPYNF